jgi:conjugal transfer/type IV secretion protein DotA/TraY
MVPLASGYTLIQALVLYIAMGGVGLANAIWSRAVQSVAIDNVPMVYVPPPQLDAALVGIMKMALCMELVKKYYNNGDQAVASPVVPLSIRVTTLGADGRLSAPNVVSDIPSALRSSGAQGSLARVEVSWADSTTKSGAICGALELPTYRTIQNANQAPLSTPAGQQRANRSAIGSSSVLALRAGTYSQTTTGPSEILSQQLSEVQMSYTRGFGTHIANLSIWNSDALKNVASAIVNRMNSNAIPMDIRAAADVMAIVRQAGIVAGEEMAKTLLDNASSVQNNQQQVQAIQASGWAYAGMYFLRMANYQAGLFAVSQLTARVTPPNPSMAGDRELEHQMGQVNVTADLIASAAGMANMGDILSQGAMSTGQPFSNGAREAEEGGSSGLVSKMTGNLQKTLDGWFQAASGDGWQNPIASLSNLGHTILTIAGASLAITGGGAIFATFMGDLLTAGTASKVAQIMVTLIAVPMGLLITALIGSGLFLAYVLPMMPFMIWTVSVLAWLILVVEAVVAAPLWAFSHLKMEGDGAISEGAYSGYRIMLAVFLRPALMVIGLFVGMSIFYLAAQYVNATFSGAARMANGGTSFGPFGLVAFCVMTVGINVAMLERCLGLIHVLPDRILRWIGSQGENLGEHQDHHRSAGMMAAAGSAIGGNLSSGMSQVSGKLAHIRQREAEGKRAAAALAREQQEKPAKARFNGRGPAE